MYSYTSHVSVQAPHGGDGAQVRTKWENRDQSNYFDGPPVVWSAQLGTKGRKTAKCPNKHLLLNSTEHMLDA